ncbi:hypothetical protein LOTGIDRAFT_173546 [Lottia gigantea]|uniref:Ig-like domain-containing protein n=1 Tax=Lottia gigantea TaxID=225164 RepID=V4A753_LOTGI|nr:hypothetical protein LOTGIDRAFT_173546 [Lottia gigantea]ESO99768.1 hypothetical protein LOTGIDRAFT_173546 [Lottia gigantea]
MLKFQYQKKFSQKKRNWSLQKKKKKMYQMKKFILFLLLQQMRQYQKLYQKFYRHLTAIHTKDGGQALFECVIAGVPKPEVVWYKDSEVIQPSEEFQIQYDENNQCSLFIGDVLPDDAGQYTVVAKNEMGEVSTTAELFVAPASELDASTESVGEIAPNFTVKPKYQKVDEGKDVSFECQVVAKPQPEIYWSKDGSDIPDDDRINVTLDIDEGDVYRASLNITDTTPEDSGTYTITATNPQGQETVSASLIVNKTLEEKTDFRDQLATSVEIQEKEKPTEVDQVDFRETLATKVKTKVNVQFEMKQFDFRHLLHKGKSSSLKFESDVTTEETIIVEEQTSVVEEASTEEVVKLEKPEIIAPKFEVVFNNLQVKEGESAKLVCRASGVPTPNITWYHAGEAIQTDDVYEITSGNEGESILTIPEVLVEDAGLYTARASNEAGQVECSATINVEEVPSDQEEKLEGVKEEVTESADQVDEADKAAIKIQAAFRGYQAREQVKVLREQSLVEDVTVPTTDQSDFVIQEEELSTQEFQYLPNTDDTLLVTEEKHLHAYPDHYEYPLSYEDPQDQHGDPLSYEYPEEQHDYPQDQHGDPLSYEYPEEQHDYPQDQNGDSYDYPLSNYEHPDNQPQDFVDHAFSGPEVDEYTDDFMHDSLYRDESANEFLHADPESDELAVGMRVYTWRMTKGDRNSPQSEPTLFKEEFEVSESRFHHQMKLDDTQEETIEDVSVEFSMKQEEITMDQTLDVDTKAEVVLSEPAPEKPQETEDVEGEFTLSFQETDTVEDVSVEFTVAPVFNKKLEDQEVPEGATIELTVNVTGQPQPEITWLREGVTIQLNEHYETRHDTEGNFTLIIHDANTEDDAEFTCTATNKAGSVSTSADLYIAPAGEAPTFIRCIEDIAVDYHAQIILEVQVKGQPKPELTLTIDGEEIPKNKYRIEEIEDVVRFIIDKAELEHEGEYTVKATNSKGVATCHAKVTLRLDGPEFEKPLETVKTKLKEMARFECVVKGMPLPEITWFVDSKPISRGPKYNFSCEDRHCVLTINDVTTEDINKTYTCRAENPVGDASTEATLTIEAEFSIRIPFELTI